MKIPIGSKSKINDIAFGKYKNAFTESVAAICGTGSSLNIYQPIDGAIHIGCNRCLFYDKFLFDFYFFNDWSKTREPYRKLILSYKPKIAKFFGTFPRQRSFGCNQNIADNGHAILYDMEGPGGGTYQVEIDKYWMGDRGMSTVFVQMQFALFCGFHTIYIVGCDIDNLKDPDQSKRYFFNNKDIVKNYNWYSPLKQKWLEMKNFIENFYPNTKIISVNPLGLKGIFEDIYQ